MLIIMIRTTILYTVIIAMMRLMGKKQLGELQPSELVTTILISNIATLSIEDPTIPMLIGIVPILMIVCIDVLMSVVMLKSPKFRRTVTGSPKIIISEGVIDRVELEKLRYTIDDVLEAMRGQSIFDISEVRYAIVETTGKINFFKKDDGATDPPCVVVKDGITEPDGMKSCGMDAKKLGRLLDKNGAKQNEVFLMTVSRDGQCTVIRKDTGKGKNG
ncbi:MAG: DUF421 domain-containing protein [Ruminiclostridium sp.]|nr:DUF421 domain-containing protein [Ruminiclostridium sp.]